MDSMENSCSNNSSRRARIPCIYPQAYRHSTQIETGLLSRMLACPGGPRPCPFVGSALLPYHPKPERSSADVERCRLAIHLSPFLCSTHAGARANPEAPISKLRMHGFPCKVGPANRKTALQPNGEQGGDHVRPSAASTSFFSGSGGRRGTICMQARCHPRVCHCRRTTSSPPSLALFLHIL